MNDVHPRYPLYIISKGRWDSRLTSKALERMGVPYHIVVEDQEREQYAAMIDPAKILILDPAYQRDYDACMALEPGQSKGSGPARNFVWDHAAKKGADRYWILDDNIRHFYRFHEARRVRANSGAIFRAMEDFTDRYENVALSGPNYAFYVNDCSSRFPPFVPNTRIFSCILIQTDIPFRWRARYNEDVDLSLRILKAGLCTIQFNAFLQGKVHTQTMRGGNTDELYANGTLEKSQMLVRLHPDVARLIWKYDRWHHHVDYRPFRKNNLIRRPDVEIPEGVNEYGMKLVKVK